MTTSFRVPFNRPSADGDEARYLAQALQSGHLSGDGPFTRRCHELLQASVGVQRALLTTSCTHALEMAALLLGIEPGDEVVVPSFTFSSTINAFVLRGARPVFADIRPDTLNLDESRLESLIGPRTRVIVAMHYAGIGCEMDAIVEIADRHGLAVVEDNAHGLFGAYRGRQLGTFGSLAALSFHETKNFSAGEGGALLINSPSLFERAEIIREKGTDRSRFFRGQVDRYSWVDLGSSYLPSELVAAYLCAQLEARDRIQTRRQQLWRRYQAELADWAEEFGVQQPTVPAHCVPAYHLYYLLLPSLRQREALIGHLLRQGVLSIFHYLPLHASAMGRRLGGRPGDCPVTESVSDRLVRLPLYNSMTPEEQTIVLEAVQSFRP